MMAEPDLRVLIEESCIAVDAALALSDIVAQHEIVESTSFNQMIIFLHSAADALAKIKSVQSIEYRIFATKDAARAALATIGQPEGVEFRIAQDGAGRASIKLVISNDA